MCVSQYVKKPVISEFKKKIYEIYQGAQQGVQKFGRTKLQFAVGRDCIQKHFSKYDIEKNAFFGP